MNKKLICLTLFLFIIFTTIGCANIPKESVMLSEELTNMIRSAEQSHLALIDEYILERRAKVDDFMEKKWIPEYMKDFVSSSNILGQIEKTNELAEKGNLMLQFSEAASKEMAKRRNSLVDVLYEIERNLKSAIEDHYNNMIIISQSLTAHLRSASEITETRRELLDKLKIKPQEIIPLDKINMSIEKLIRYEGKVEDLKEVVNEVKEIIIGEK